MTKKQTIKFRSTRSISKLGAGKVCYQAQIISNQTLSERETREAYAAYTHQEQPMANFAINSLCAFMIQQLAMGNRLNFGDFFVGLRMRGSLPAANAPFDAEKNTLTVEMTPGKALKAAVCDLSPVNETDTKRSEILNSEQLTPVELLDTIVATGTRTVIATGSYILVHPEGEGEGVWIENDAGGKLLKGRVLPGSDLCKCIFELTGDIAPGRYWLNIQSRTTPESQLLRCKRRITAA